MQAKKGLNVMNTYLLRRYDTYFNDVRHETIIACVDDETAINTAKSTLLLSIHPLDTVEIQVCRKGLSMGEWCMFAAVYYYDDDEIAIDDCFC